MADNYFVTREVTCSLFTYTVADFKRLNAANALPEWEEALNETSYSYPVYKESPFDEQGLGLATSIDKEPEVDLVYVIPHYFYAEATYATSAPINKEFNIKLASVLGSLIEERPMDWAERRGEKVTFEGQDATDGSQFAISFYFGTKRIDTVMLADVDDQVLADVARECVKPV